MLAIKAWQISYTWHREVKRCIARRLWFPLAISGCSAPIEIEQRWTADMQHKTRQGRASGLSRGANTVQEHYKHLPALEH